MPQTPEHGALKHCVTVRGSGGACILNKHNRLAHGKELVIQMSEKKGVITRFPIDLGLYHEGLYKGIHSVQNVGNEAAIINALTGADLARIKENFIGFVRAYASSHGVEPNGLHITLVDKARIVPAAIYRVLWDAARETSLRLSAEYHIGEGTDSDSFMFSMTNGPATFVVKVEATCLHGVRSEFGNNIRSILGQVLRKYQAEDVRAFSPDSDLVRVVVPTDPSSRIKAAVFVTFGLNQSVDSSALAKEISDLMQRADEIDNNYTDVELSFFTAHVHPVSTTGDEKA